MIIIPLYLCKVELSGSVQPEKQVKSEADIQKWIHSQAYYDLIGFINGISTAIQGKKISDDIYVSNVMKQLLGIFDKLNEMVDEIPPTDQPQRFGNKSFRTWSRRMNNVCTNFMIFEFLLNFLMRLYFIGYLSNTAEMYTKRKMFPCGRVGVLHVGIIRKFSSN